MLTPRSVPVRGASAVPVGAAGLVSGRAMTAGLAVPVSLPGQVTAVRAVRQFYDDISSEIMLQH